MDRDALHNGFQPNDTQHNIKDTTFQHIYTNGWVSTNFSQEDLTWAEFSTIDVIVHLHRWIRAHRGNSLAYS